MIAITTQADALLPMLRELTAFKAVDKTFQEAYMDRELPALILEPADATYDRESYGAYSLVIRRRWHIHIYAGRVTAGREGDMADRLFGLVVDVITHLAQHPSIALDNGQSIELDLNGGRDTGVQVLQNTQNPTLAIYATTVDVFVIDEAHIEPE